MYLDISGIRSSELDFFPETVEKEIIQNIQVILTTYAGTVPLDRKFGISTSAIDMPLPMAKTKWVIDIAESVQDYEPRVEVLEVDFVEDINNVLDGKLYPKVRVRIKNEYLNK